MSKPNNSPQYEDLSFLDDFNIDEIVECLHKCEENNNVEGCAKTNKVKNLYDIDVITKQNATKHDTTAQINKEFEAKNKTVQFHEITSPINNKDKSNYGHNLKLSENITKNGNIVTNDNKIKSTKEKQKFDKFNGLIKEKDIAKIDNQTVTTEINYKKNNSKINNKNKFDSTYIDACEEKCNSKNLASKEHDKLSRKIQLEDTALRKIKITESGKKDLKSKKIQNELKVLCKNNKEHTGIEATKVIKSTNYIKTSPKSLIQSNAEINLCKNLKQRMLEYLHTEYYVESIIHNGKFSKIFKCFDSAGQPHAVKMLRYEWSKFDHSLKQDKIFTDIQADIPKENLCSVYVFNTFSIKGHWCFLMEFQTKNLKQALEESKKPFHIDLVQDLARQLVAVVKLLKSYHIIHSDIKPSHILLNSSNTRLKLCGFDDAYYSKEIKLMPYIGSEHYRPPEVILGYSAGFSIDVWTTALVLHEMATKEKLFAGDHNADMLHKQICTLGNIPFEMLQGSLFKSKHFVGGLFRKRPVLPGEDAALVSNFYRDFRLQTTTNDAYFEHWASTRTERQKDNDINKIRAFLGLLRKMLVICPNYRIPMEYVDTEPFICEMFDL